jgi:ferredoxin
MIIKFKNKKNKIIYDTKECMKNLNLLAHAQLIELEIGSRCGGHGICGKDKVKIPQDKKNFFSKPTEIEHQKLSQKELNENIRLACQCFPEFDNLDLIIEF